MTTDKSHLPIDPHPFSTSFYKKLVIQYLKLEKVSIWVLRFTDRALFYKLQGDNLVWWHEVDSVNFFLMTTRGNPSVCGGHHL